MRTIDVSMPLFVGMPSFPGDPAFAIAPAHSIARGDAYNVSALSMGTHAGTHVDPPLHFFPKGTPTDRLDLDLLRGPCRVVDVPSGSAQIGPEDVARAPAGTERVLFRTANSQRWARELAFFSDYVALSPAGARALVGAGVRLVGLDALSIERDTTGTFPVHHELLGRGALILEGLMLADAPEGDYVLDCLPLRIRGGDGGPARVVLRTEARA
jgi:arylformamidase